MSIQHVDMAKHVSLFLEGCEFNEQSNPTNLIFKRQADNIVITIQEQKPGGKTWHYKAKLSFDLLKEVTAELENAEKNPG